MNFFTQLIAASSGLDLNIRIKEKNGKITLSILPGAGSGDSHIKPLIVTGTPEELDADFFTVVTPALEKAKGLVSNADAFEKEEGEKESKQEKPKKKAEPKKEEPKSKEAAPKKPFPKITEPSIFDQSAASAETKSEEPAAEVQTEEIS